jgi:hypothetical protein
MMGRAIVAERLARQLPEEAQTATLTAIITQLLAWPLADDQVTSNVTAESQETSGTSTDPRQ